MQIDSKYKLEKAVSMDKDRADELGRVFIRKDQTALATDGRMIAVVPCAVGKRDACGCVLPDALVYARNHGTPAHKKLGVTELHLLTETEVVAADSTRFPRTFAARVEETGEQLALINEAPEQENHLDEDAVEMVPARMPDDVVLRLDPARLKRLCDALGVNKDAPACTIRVRPDADGVVRQPFRVDTAEESASGALAPMRLD